MDQDQRNYQIENTYYVTMKWLYFIASQNGANNPENDLNLPVC